MGRSIRDVPLSPDWHNHTINRALDNAHVQTQIKSISGLKTADSVIQPSALSFNLCIGHMLNISVVNVHMATNEACQKHIKLSNKWHLCISLFISGGMK